MLIHALRDHVRVFAYVLIAFLLLVAVLAPILGVDSRIDEVGRRRGLGH